MFRRKRNVVVPSRLARQRREAAPTRATQDIAAKVESGVQAAFQFASGLLAVVQRLLLRPFGLVRAADRRGVLHPAVPPTTFVVLVIFLATRSLRILVATLFIAMLALQRSCAPETQIRPELPKVSALFEWPSLEDMVITGIPCTLLVLVVVMALARAACPVPGARRRQVFNLCLYVVGLQYLLAILALAWMAPREALLDALKNPQSPRLGDFFKFEWWQLWSAGLVVLVWPAIVLAANVRQLSAARGHGAAVRRAVAAALASLGTLCAGAVAVVPLVRLDVTQRMAPNPVLKAALVNRESAGGGMERLTFLVTNRSAAPQHLWLGAVGWQPRDSDHQRVLAITQWPNPATRLVTVRAGESTWFVAADETAGTMQACQDGDREQWHRAGGSTPPPKGMAWPDWLFGSLDYPTPDGTAGRICLARVVDNGSSRSTLSFVGP